MTLNDTEKLNYINNTFHQYFDLTLNTNITTTENVNLIINIQKLFDLGDSISTTSNYHHDISISSDFNIDMCLNKYNNTEIEKELEAVCLNVEDGDTILAKIIQEDGSTYNEYVRLVGVDTPELNSAGYQDSKTFVEKCCYSKKYYDYKINPSNYSSEIYNTKHIYLNVDSKKERDKYGRLLAVIIVDNKNLNEILLKEKIAQVMYIPPSEFNPNDWKDIGTSISLYNYKNDDMALLSTYFNPDMSNIVFTPQNNTKTLYRHEVYKGNIYLKLSPFSQNIRMHILPKPYDCSNNVLILKDSDINKRRIAKSANYVIYDDKDNINAYFQENGEDRDRNNIVDREYNKNDWAETPDGVSKTFVDFSYDISNSTESFNNLQICCGYRYNKTSPYYSLHYTGIRDNKGDLKDRCTLVDANIDNIKEESTDVITQMKFNDSPYLPHDPEILQEVGKIDHTSTIGVLHHKILKYINDLLYVEEDEVYKSQQWINQNNN